MLGTIAAILPADTDKVRKLTWEELETEVKNEMYCVSADELAHLIIAGDPSFNLIDIRRANEADSMKYTPPSILHISTSPMHLQALPNHLSKECFSFRFDRKSLQRRDLASYHWEY